MVQSPVQTLGTNQVQIDPTALALSRAIRAAEGGNYQKVGDVGTSAGAYQWNNGKIGLDETGIPANFKSAAIKFGLNPNDFSQTNQDHVAYEEIKADLDAGLTQSQIAAKWNSGLTTGWENHVGDVVINGKTVHYDTPAYVNRVKSVYLQQTGGSPMLPTATPPNQPGPAGSGIGTLPTAIHPPALAVTPPINTPPKPTVPHEDQTLGQQLGGRLGEAWNAFQAGGESKINPISSGLQVAGAGAGALGDITTRGMDYLPFFGKYGYGNEAAKDIKTAFSKGIEWTLQTPVGQSVVKNIQQFQKDHPEISGDIGAGYNIVTAIPILQAIYAVKNAAFDAASRSLQDVAEKSMTNELTGVISSTKAGNRLLQQIPDGVRGLVDARALPDIETVGGVSRYSTANAVQTVSDTVGNIDETQLQPILEQISAQQNFGQSLASLKQLAIQEAENDPLLKESGMVPQAVAQIEKRFAGWQYSYGDAVDIATENRLKIGTGKFVADWNTPEASADKVIYRALQHNIEDVAKANGFGDAVAVINGQMADLLDAKDLFQFIDGKRLATPRGLFHQAIGAISTAGGEAAGTAIGLPIAGAIAGVQTSGFIENLLKRFGPDAIRAAILSRTGPGASIGTDIGGLIGRLLGAGVGATAQKLNPPK